METSHPISAPLKGEGHRAEGKETEDSKRKLKAMNYKIKKQMEFYFSDSNLTSDKFLLKLINESPDGYVDLEVFKSFNRIKSITQNTEEISAAISKSNNLELSPDRQKVRRVTPLTAHKDFDACTIYVEKLPHYADQRWMRDIFGRFGTITHINVPRFEASGKIKGFAFVEFSAEDSVQKACEFYKCVKKETEKENRHQKNGTKKKPTTISEKGNEFTIPDKVDKPVIAKSELMETDDEKHIDVKPPEADADVMLKKDSRKRCRDESDCEILPKYAKVSDNETEEMKVIKCESPDKNSSTDKARTEEKETLKSECIEKSKGENYKHENKKNHNKSRDDIQLKVITKAEWKCLRNKYLALQRDTTSYLKKVVMLEAQKLHSTEPSTEEMDQTATNSFQFMPDVILKITLEDAIQSTVGIKSQVKAHATVAYIDAPEGHNAAYIRCHTAEDAEKIVTEKKLNHLGMIEILKGAEEKTYWEKVEQDRANKYSSVQTHRKKGKDKIMAEAPKITKQQNKHMYFDE